MPHPDFSAIFKSFPDNYGANKVPLAWENKNIFVISDLHLGAGINANNNYDGSENFFADESFVRFIDHIQSIQPKEEPALLVINGDFVDFIRIGNIPGTEKDFLAWQEALQSIGIQKTTTELQDSIVKKERTYGLKTNDYKSVWKLHVSATGHRSLVKRLGKWLLDGNHLAIVKGNHDLEWYWPSVRQYLSVLLAASIAAENALSTNEVLQHRVLPRISFYDDTVIINQKIYIEHGHRYQNMTEVKGDAVLKGSEELNLPFGSFFNRYLINRLELAYPFLDNVRPSQNILPILLRERFPLAIKVMFQYIPFLLLIIPKKIYWETFKYLLSFIFVIVAPLAITGVALWLTLKDTNIAASFSKGQTSWAMKQVVSVAQNFGFLFLSYLFGRILVKVRLKDPPSLYGHAQEILMDNANISIITFGHTHDPEQMQEDGKWYLNTGTWIPIYESSSASVRLDKTYTFLHLGRDKEGEFVSQPLQRWNDEALREECLFLNDRK